MYVFLIFSIFSLLIENIVNSHSATEWTDRTIYQVLTDRIAFNGSGESCKDLKHYCGGTYDGIKSKLDYIQEMGFDSLWISPMLLNMGEDYHGYAFIDLYQLSDHFGSEESLNSLILEAHKRNIWIMLDVVGNHVAPIDEQYQLVNPFNQSKYYHSKCQIEEWNNQTQVEYCRLADLPDLDQTNEFVKSKLVEWVASLKDKYDFDGLRIDTIPEVNTDFWDEFVPAAKMYTIGEVFNGNIDYVAPYQNHVDGVLSYPLYYTMLDVFAHQQSMYKIQDLLGPNGSYFKKFKNINYLGTFIDNHDNQRFLYIQSNTILYKNALAMTIMNCGIPIIYYGSEQAYNGGDDPANRESLWPNYDTNSDLYKFISILVKTRKNQKLSIQSQIQRYASDDFYSFSRDKVLVCLTNSGGNTITKDITYLPYVNGDIVCNIFDLNECLTVNNGLTIFLTNGLPKIFVPK